VISVGGSTLQITSSGTYSGESVWYGGGGGSSRYEGLPSYQNGLGLTNRGTPDVSYDANPSTGVAVYDSYGSGGWAEYGGTSVGAPQWAALIAIADQGRALSGKGSLANAQDVLYTLPSTDFHDITSGSNGYSATTGYDLASGRGSPIANLVVSGLVAYSGSTSFTQSAPTSTTRGGGGFGWGGFSGFGGDFFDVPAGGQSAAAGGSAAGNASTSGAGDVSCMSLSGDASVSELDSFFASGGNCADSQSALATESAPTINNTLTTDNTSASAALSPDDDASLQLSSLRSSDAGDGVSEAVLDTHFATLGGVPVTGQM